MNPLFDFLFSQYSGYDTLDIVLELVAAFFTVTSVVYAKKNNVLVFPTGMICTAIFVYLLLKWGLLGDMMINGYYFIMSLYGWYIWTRNVDDLPATPISKTSPKEHLISLGIFIVTVVFVFLVYTVFDKFNHWTSYLDTLTTGIFFVGMWLMAKRKIENWIYWIIIDLVSIYLYAQRDYNLTAVQYGLFTILAVFGFFAWRKEYKTQKA